MLMNGRSTIIIFIIVYFLRLYLMVCFNKTLQLKVKFMSRRVGLCRRLNSYSTMICSSTRFLYDILPEDPSILFTWIIPTLDGCTHMCNLNLKNYSSHLLTHTVIIWVAIKTALMFFLNISFYNKIVPRFFTYRIRFSIVAT